MWQYTDSATIAGQQLDADYIYEAEKQVKAAGWPAKPVRKGKYGNYQLWIADPDGLEIECMQILPDFLLGNA